MEHRIQIKGGKARLLPPRTDHLSSHQLWEKAERRYDEYQRLLKQKQETLGKTLLEGLWASMGVKR